MIKIDLDKAKEIAHNTRRVVREQEIKPLDVQVTIPMYAEQAELERQVVRNKYAVMQEQIDQANDVDELKSILNAITN